MIHTIHFTGPGDQQFRSLAPHDREIAALDIHLAQDTPPANSCQAMHLQVALPDDLERIQEQAAIRKACDDIISFVNEVDFSDAMIDLVVHCGRDIAYSAAVAKFVAALYGRPLIPGTKSVESFVRCRTLTNIMHDAYIESCLCD
jgi:predicted protein tyrosine phosphatase